MRGNCFALAARAAAAAILGLLLLLPTARDAGASERRNDRILLPSAGWHGRAIQEPHRHETVLTSTAGQLRGWSAGPVRYGDGFHRPGGSDRVREVQRRLARLGYRVGPIDGLFGRLTRASVAWFQVKHGLPVTGRATLATVDHLRARTGAPPGPGAARTAQPPAESEPAAARAPAWEAFRQLVGPRVPVPGGRSARTGWPHGDVGADRPRRRRRPAAARAARAAAALRRHPDDRARPARARRGAPPAGGASEPAVRPARPRGAGTTTRRRAGRDPGGPR